MHRLNKGLRPNSRKALEVKLPPFPPPFPLFFCPETTTCDIHLLVSTTTTTMQNTFIPDAIELVSRAITADNEGEYDRALSLYRDALSRFTIGLKYEKNESKKRLILERVEGYMKRAEELRDYLNKQAEVNSNSNSNESGGGGVGGAGTKPKGAGEDDLDAEKAKLRGALSGAIVTEKPNVKWEDVAGLEGAKESLKETVILPTRFPQLFTGKRRPFKGILLYGPPGTGEDFLLLYFTLYSSSIVFRLSFNFLRIFVLMIANSVLFFD